MNSEKPCVVGEENTQIWLKEDKLVIQGIGKVFNSFEGEVTNDKKVCDLTHANRLALNKALPWTAPSAIGVKEMTFGLGDRLGMLNEAQLTAIERSKAKPILAQQSLRELSLTGRTYSEVIDAASFAVFKRQWTKGWGADGDHLKHYEDIAEALNAGCTMITLDCSEALKLCPNDMPKLEKEYLKLSKQIRDEYQARYLFNLEAEALGIEFSEESLMRSIVIYRDAINFAVKIYSELIRPLNRKIDFEISLDETDETTTYEGHFFVASELSLNNVSITSLAPRFVGEFHKGIDYIGKVEAFKTDLEKHANISKSFGYKISIHSGSDKYSIFPFVSELTDYCFHLKTSGTSWLMAAKTIAKVNPTLYREMHRCAIKHFEEARAYYVVHAELENVPNIDEISDDQLLSLFDVDDARQLIHITYGFMFAEIQLKEKIFATLKAEKEAMDEEVSQNIFKHLESLKIV